MKRLFLAAAFALTATAAHAACNPSDAPPNSIGCQPALPSAVQTTDLLLGWRPSLGKTASRTITPAQLLQAGLPGAFATLSASGAAALASTLSVGSTAIDAMTVAGGGTFGPSDYRQIEIMPSGTEDFGTGSPQILRVRRVGSDNTAGVTYSNLWVTRSSWVLTGTGAPAGTRFNAVFDTGNSAGADPGAVWGVLSTLSTAASVDSQSAVSSYIQAVRSGVPAGGKVGVPLEAAVIEFRDASGLSTATTGLARTLELDMFVNGADDLAGSVGREVMPIVLGKANAGDASPTITSIIGVYPVAGDGVHIKRGITWAGALNFDQSLFDTRDSVQGTNAAAVWLKDGHKLAVDGGSTGDTAPPNAYLTHGSSRLQWWAGGTETASISDAGKITFNGGMAWNAGGSFSAGNLARDANWGLWLQGASGSAADIALAASGGTAAIKIPSTAIVQMDKGAYAGGSAANTWSGTALLPPNLALASIRTFNGTLPVGQSSDNGAHLNWVKAVDNMVVGSSGVSAISHFAVNGTMGSTATGNRVAHNVTLAVPVLTANAAASRNANYNAGSFYVYSTANQGGSAQTTAGANSSLFGNIFIARTGSSATYFRDLVGLEIDMISETVAGTAPLRKVGIQIVGYNDGTLVDTSQGAFIDAGLLFAHSSTLSVPGWRHGILFGQNNSGLGLSATGTAIMFQAKSPSGSIPTLNTTGYGVDGLQATWASAFLRSKQFSVGPDGTVQVFSGYLAPTANGVSLDASGRVGTAEGGTLAMGGTSTGGTGWVSNEMVFDSQGLGFVGYVSGVSAGAVTQITVLRQAIKNGAAPTNPVALVGRAGTLGAGLAADMTWTVKGQMDFGTTGATLVNIGNGSANVVVGSGSAIATNATSGFLQLPTMAGAPTGTVGAAGKAAVVIDTTNNKICWSTGGGTWKCALGS